MEFTKSGELHTTASLNVGRAGDAAIGVRVTLEISTQGLDIEYIADYVIVRVGCAISIAIYQDVGGFDHLQARLTRLAARRLAAGLKT